MKRNQFLFYFIALVITILSINSFAQDPLEFIPAEVTPHDTGYYKYGTYIWKDGGYIHVDSCEEEFEDDLLHFESGIYNGFTYDRCLVMPTCQTKDDPEEGMHLGFVQLVKAYFPGTDSTIFAEIVSPGLQNLSEIYVEFSVDVTPRDDRPVVAWIQYSKDNGLSWEEDAFIQWSATAYDKDGERMTYNADHATQGFPFQTIALASQTAPIKLRIVAAWPYNWVPPIGEWDVHRVRVFYWKITADPLTGISPVSMENKPFFEIKGNVISGVDGRIRVYNMLGYNLGTVESIALSTGIYIVQSSKGQIQKVYIEKQ